MLVFKNNKLSSLKYEHPSTQQRTEVSVLALVLLCTPGRQDAKLYICAQQGPLESHLQDPRSAEKHCIRHGGMTWSLKVSISSGQKRIFPTAVETSKNQQGPQTFLSMYCLMSFWVFFLMKLIPGGKVMRRSFLLCCRVSAQGQC